MNKQVVSNQPQKKRRRRLGLRWASFGIALFLACGLAGVRREAPYYLELLELRAIDFRLQFRGSIPIGDEVVIAGIDEKSVTELGRWPWPRSRLATLISQLTRLGAETIALDIVFAEPQPEDDDELAQAIRRSGKVVLGYFLEFPEDQGGRQASPSPVLTEKHDEREPPLTSEYNLVRFDTAEAMGKPHLHEAAQVVGNIALISAAATHAGFFTVSPDRDGIYRRIPLAIQHQEKILTPLSLEALRVYLHDPQLSIAFGKDGARVSLAQNDLSVTAYGELWVNYAGPARTFPHYSVSDLIAGEIAAEKIKGKIVLIGATAKGIYDLRATPFDPRFPGVETHANVINNILHQNFLVRPWWLIPADIGVLLLLGLLLGAILAGLKGVGGIVLSVSVLSAYFWGSQLFFVQSGVPLSVVYPVLLGFIMYPSVTLFHYMTEEREKRRVRDAFSLYLHPEVARMVSDNPALLHLGGEKRELTVMFTDIRGFTSISETFDPEALVEFLNEYLGAMTDIVFQHDGLLDKYIGDAIMALWGAPFPRPDHAAQACRTALEMIGRLRVLQQDWLRRGLPPLEIGVGVNTGPMVVGNMGSTQRFNYTAMGDHVNLGSRLEGLNKFYGTRILLSEYTRAEIGDEFLLREIDAVRVKGKQQPVTIFELLAYANGDGSVYQFQAEFAEALKAYKARQWDGALQRFSEFLGKHPDDGPAQIYQERCRLLMADPPPKDWDGVFVMESK